MAADAPVLYLIDGHAQFFRAYYAIRSRMSSPVTKEPTQMTFGFFNMLLKLLREQPPEYLAVVIDVAGDRESFRSEIYPEYKANRDAAPDDFHPQVERSLEILGQMNIPVIGEPGVEADDVIATIARRLVRERDDVIIRVISRDKDLTQLVGDRIEMYDPFKDELVTPSDIFKTEGVDPSQVIDILALMGDTSDNVPGVEGIGPKTAAKLILEYGSIENLYANIDRIKGKRRENLEAAREQVPVSQRLVTLVDDVEVDFALEDAAYRPGEMAGDEQRGWVRETFKDLGFGRLQDDLAALAGAAPDAAAADDDSGGVDLFGFSESLFDQGNTKKPAAMEADYEIVRTRDQLANVIDAARQAGTFAFDTETDGLLTRQSNLVGVSIATAAGKAWYIPVRSPTPEEHLDVETVIDALRDLLCDDALVKIGHNLKFDLNVLRHHGLDMRGHTTNAFDTMIASYVLDASRSAHRLDVLARAHLDYSCLPLTDLIGTGKSQKGFDEVALEYAGPYAAEDADVTLRLHGVLRDQLERAGLMKLFREVEMPLVEVLAELEYNGITVDPDELDRQRAGLLEQIEVLRRDISADAPHPFNPDSPKQLAAVLFNSPLDDPPGLGLKPIKRGKTGPSTDVEVLEKLAADETIDTPLPQQIVEYRQLTKLVNTYLLALKEVINDTTKRVHASFNQTVAATGRLSSSDPNLQNIPIRTDVGREIRRAFVAQPGHVLLTADYSQIELRLLAHLSQDPELIRAFEQGQDIHTAVAATVFGVDPDNVDATQRNAAKMVNFGIVYGITPYGLARRLGPGYTVEYAARIIDDYKARFVQIDVFLQQCIQQAISDGYVETILGRRRPIPQITERNPMRRALGERMAINTVVQGSAADLIKVAMIRIYRELPQTHPQTRMLLQIHDELVFETPAPAPEVVEQVRDSVVGWMAGAMDLRVPLVAEAAWSGNWVDAK